METEVFRVALWVTSICNLKCKYCYEGIEKESAYMNQEIAKSAIDYVISQMDQLKIKNCLMHFHGGEPLLSFNTVKYIINSIKQNNITDKDFSYSITTNGTILDERIKEFLLDNFDTISISLDGTQKVHDSNRIFHNGTGSHSIALRNGVELLKHKNIRVRMTITPDNVSAFFDSVVFLIESGFKLLVPAFDYFSDSWSNELIETLRDQLIKTSEYLESHSEKDVIVYKINKDDIAYKGECNGGITNINIDPFGNIFPCTYTVGKKEYICGTIFTGTYEEKIKEIQDLNHQIVSDCISCNYYKFCPTSSCKLINRCITGSFLKASPVICATETVKMQLSKLKKIEFGGEK